MVVTFFRLTCSVVLWGGRNTANKYRWHVWEVLAVSRPHWVCPHSQHMCFSSLHCSGSSLLFQELSEVGPGLHALPRSKPLRFRYSGTPQRHRLGWARVLCPSQYLRRRQWQATPELLPRKSHGWRSLVGCSPSGLFESDTTERLHFHFSLSHNGEGNGNPLQCSCLENPRDGRAWWAAIYGVAQSRTPLKQLNSSSLGIS